MVLQCINMLMNKSQSRSYDYDPLAKSLFKIPPEILYVCPSSMIIFIHIKKIRVRPVTSLSSCVITTSFERHCRSQSRGTTRIYNSNILEEKEIHKKNLCDACVGSVVSFNIVYR